MAIGGRNHVGHDVWARQRFCALVEAEVGIGFGGGDRLDGWDQSAQLGPASESANRPSVSV
jgi:hypothetical protein